MESSHGLQPRVQNRDGGKKDIWKLSDWRLTPLLINCREMRFTSLMWCVIIFQPSKQSLQHLQCPNPSQRLLAASVAWFCGTFNSYHSFCRQKRLQMLDSGFFFKTSCWRSSRASSIYGQNAVTISGLVQVDGLDLKIYLSISFHRCLLSHWLL